MGAGYNFSVAPRYDEPTSLSPAHGLFHRAFHIHAMTFRETQLSTRDASGQGPNRFTSSRLRLLQVHRSPRCSNCLAWVHPTASASELLNLYEEPR